MTGHTIDTPQVQQPTTRFEPKGSNTLVVILLTVIMNLAATAGALWYYDKNYALKIESMDLRAYTTELTLKRAAGKITEDDVNKLILNLKDKISKEAAATSPKTVVILKEVILNGSVPEIKP